MKKIISFSLSVFIFVMMIDFVSLKSIPLFFHFSNQEITTIQLINTQYEIYEKAKNVITNIGDIILNDLQIILTSKTNNNLSFDCIKYSRDICFCFINTISNKFLLNSSYSKCFNIININEKFRVLILLIILFMIDYLGLLKVYWSNKKYNFLLRACKI